MEVRHRIHEFSTSPKFAALKRELDRLEVDYRIQRLGATPTGEDWQSIEYLIGESDPLFPEVAALVVKHDIQTQVGLSFTEEEITSAEWVWAGVGEYQYPQPEYPGYLEATYDLSDYCPRCGIGAIQDRPFRLPGDFKQRTNQFLGLHWAFDAMFLRPQTKAILERANITGVTYDHPIYHKSGEELTSVYQMRITSTSKLGLALKAPSPVTCKPENEESRAKGMPKIQKPLAGPPYCEG